MGFYITKEEGNSWAINDQSPGCAGLAAAIGVGSRSPSFLLSTTHPQEGREGVGGRREEREEETNQKEGGCGERKGKGEAFASPAVAFLPVHGL